MDDVAGSLTSEVTEPVIPPPPAPVDPGPGTVPAIGLVVDGNVWGRPGATTPTVLATSPTGSSSTRTYPTLAALTAGIAQEAHGAELTGPALVDAAYRLTAETTAAAAVVQPLPGWISALAGASGLDPWLGARFA